MIKRVYIVLCAITIAFAAPAVTRADITLKGADRVDPCNEMKTWQNLASQGSDDPISWELVGEFAEACGRTYGVQSDDQTCDIVTIAAAAYGAAAHLESDPLRQRVMAGKSFAAYEFGRTTCTIAKRSQAFMDSVQSSLDRALKYYLSLRS